MVHHSKLTHTINKSIPKIRSISLLYKLYKISINHHMTSSFIKSPKPKYHAISMEICSSVANLKSFSSVLVLIVTILYILDLFFSFAYICFTLATVYLVGLVNSNIQSPYFKVFNFIFCWGQNISYLLVALSNPGIKLP